MLTVTLVTKNKHKIESMRRVLEPQGIGLEVENFYVPEIQADNAEEVAAFSAQYAANYCSKPVLKADSGLFIEALNGLPGVYTSQFQKLLGPEKLLKLLEGEANRKARIVYALAFCRPGENPVMFVSDCEGVISEQIRGKEGMLIDFLFIPQGSNQTLGELRETDPSKREQAWGDAEQQFVQWYWQQNV